MMKSIWKLFCGMVALAAATACTNDDLVPMEETRQPADGKVVSVTAYAAGDKANSRVAYTKNENDNGFSLAWDTEESFSVIRGGENQTFSKTTEGNTFTGTLPAGEGEYYAFYPVTDATDTDNVPLDLAAQTGELDSKKTYMSATSTDGTTFRFEHRTAILKATFSGLPDDATISKVVVTTSDATAITITIDHGTNPVAATKEHYIYLPPMAKDDAGLEFAVITSAGDYSGTLSATKDIEAGKLYTATVALSIPYLTFRAEAAQTFKMTVKNSYTLDESLQYSVGGGDWTQLTADTDIPFGGENGVLRLRGKSSTGTATARNEYSTITFTDTNVPVACTGDIRTLVNWENYATVSTSDAKFCFLFRGCTSLTKAPELKATALAVSCYESMFEGCTSLTTAPALPATALAERCYFNMFWKCTSLTEAPELPATELALNCCQYMFQDCTSLKTAPALPATTLAENCYASMFSGCTSLTTAPALPAETLAASCYNSMFKKCTSLNSVTMLATNINASYCLYNWLDGVSSTGTFTKAAEMTTLPTGSSGIPSGWEVQDYTAQ